MQEQDFYHAQAILPPDDTWQVLEQLHPPRRYGRDEMVYLMGERADAFYYVRRGRVKIFLSSEAGLEKTLAVMERGNVFGEASFFDGLPRMSSAKTLCEAELVEVGRDALLDCFSRAPGLAMEMLRYLARTVRMLSAQLDGMAFLQADRRIARLLLDLSGTNASLSCSQEELGNLAGVSRVTASRALNDLARRGWIALKYREVCIRDRAALARFVNGPA